MQKEIYALKKITSEIKKPITCIIGGSKISTKINIIKNLIKKFDYIIIVGAMANNIFKFKGLKIGCSIAEENSGKIIAEIFNEAKKNNCNIYYPTDIKVGKFLKDNSQEKFFDQIDEDDYILDLGNNSIKQIKKIIDKSETILWNGPAGYFENSEFSNGSKEIAKYIASKQGNIYSVVGGGDTVSIINSLNLINCFNFVSTAGGAFLEYLEGKNLPGIKALKLNVRIKSNSLKNIIRFKRYSSCRREYCNYDKKIRGSVNVNSTSENRLKFRETFFIRCYETLYRWSYII